MRQKLHRGRRSVFRKRNPAPRIIGGILAAVAVVAIGFFGAKWMTEHPVTAPDDSSAPTVSAPDTSAPADVPADSTPTPPTADTVRGFYLPFSALTGDSLTTTLATAKEAGFTAVLFDLKDAQGQLYYRFSCADAVQVNSFTPNALTADQLTALFSRIREAGLLPIPRLYAFQDDAGAKALASARITPKGNPGWVWYDGNPQNGAKAWLNPYSDEAHAYIGALASTVSVWLLGIAVAAYVTRRYVTQFRYSADSRRFRIERLYGDRARFMLEFSLSNIIKTGTPDEIKTAYPGAKRDNACIYDSSLTTFAVAYKYDGEIRILLAQPDERMRAKLGIREK